MNAKLLKTAVRIMLLALLVLIFQPVGTGEPHHGELIRYCLEIANLALELLSSLPSS